MTNKWEIFDTSSDSDIQSDILLLGIVINFNESIRKTKSGILSPTPTNTAIIKDTYYCKACLYPILRMRSGMYYSNKLCNNHVEGRFILNASKVVQTIS